MILCLPTTVNFPTCITFLHQQQYFIVSLYIISLKHFLHLCLLTTSHFVTQVSTIFSPDISKWHNLIHVSPIILHILLSQVSIF